MTPSHEDLTRQITEQLYWDQRVDASTIGVEVHDARVTLRGTVPSFFVRMAAEYDAWSVPGVRTVANELEVVFPREIAVPSDESIRSRIVDTLLWDPNVAIESVEVAVEAGAVTLSGTIDAFWKKIRVEEQTREILGVRTVHNRLRVVPREEASDEQIEAAIGDALARHGASDFKALRVAVDGGRVRLGGRVRDRNTYIAAENVARHTPGVVDIENNVDVEVSPRPGENTTSA
jgi:osmotically-inducible protein OsmY